MRTTLALLLALTVPAHAEDADTPRVPRKYKLLALETVGLAGLGQAWYYRHGASTNSGDWELPGNWGAIRSKLSGDGIRFDGDGFDTNAMGHPIFGTTSYLLAREDGFGIAGSFLYASAMSGAWETFGEWREYASINDLLFTSTSGVPLGEALYQMIHHRPRIEISGGMGMHSEAAIARTIEDVAVRGELDTPQRVRFALDLPRDSSGLRSEQLGLRASIASYRSGGFYLGAETGFDYRHKMDRPNESWDLQALVGIGPAIDYRSGGLDVGVDTALRTGMIKPEAYGDWRAMNPTAVLRGSIQQNPHGYYHGYGVAFEPYVSYSVEQVTVGASLGEGVYRAFHGHDRYQSMITADPYLGDRESAAAAWVGLRAGPALLRVDVSTRSRSGDMGNIHAESTESSVLASAGIRF